MYMEQKKTLWIIAAAGAFLLVVLAAAGIMYSPSKNQAQAIRTSVVYTNDGPVSNGNGWVSQQNKNENFTDVVPPAEKKDLYVFTDNATVYELAGKNQELPADNQKANGFVADSNNSSTIDLNLLKQELVSDKTPPQQPQQNINITVNLPADKDKTENKVSDVSSSTVSKKSETDAKSESLDYYVAKNDSKQTSSSVQPAPAPAKKAEAPKPAQKTNVTAKPAETPKAPVVTQYWVQVASYSNKKGAESARAVLDANRIPADIFTYVDAKEKMFFRVRVGPYTTKSEAEYWRTKINKIDEFSKAESYITSTQS